MQESGLEQVFMANRPKLLRFLRARLGEDQEAEDCLQDLWIKLQSIESGPVADPLPYLFTMARNVALDRRRSALHRSQRDSAWVSARLIGPEGADDAPSAERRLIDQERLRAMEAVLEGLPERTAAAFRMFRLERIPQKRIAHDFGISVSAVEKHLQRAYRAILGAQASLDADFGDPQRPDEERESRFGKR
jgi:RNA polymerase sigma-70 factor (ECF subfamily)